MLRMQTSRTYNLKSLSTYIYASGSTVSQAENTDTLVLQEVEPQINFNFIRKNICRKLELVEWTKYAGAYSHEKHCSYDHRS
jgi:hypothetical protein